MSPGGTVCCKQRNRIPRRCRFPGSSPGMPGRWPPTGPPGCPGLGHPCRDSCPPASGPGSRSPPAAVPGSSQQVVHGGDLRFRPPQGTASRQQTGQHRCCQQLLPSVFHRVSPFKSAVPNITGVKGLFLHSSGEHRQDNTNFLQLYGEISYRFLTVPETTKRSASFGSRTFLYPSITSGDDGAVGAGVAARTAVQASGSVDDVLVIALADSTGGASVRAGAAAHAGRSDFVSHGKHLHKICTPIVAYKLKKARAAVQILWLNFSKKYGKASKKTFVKTNCSQIVFK